MKPQAESVQKSITGIPSTSAASNVKVMKPSDTILLTGGSSSLAHRFSDDDPSGAVASSALLFHSLALFLILFPSTPSINSLASFSTFSAFTSPISMPTSHSLQMNLQFVG
ncbi:hypothetical protein RJ639_028108 [Escallonia herrerae]|uniref:Uncharacterized protein n=1 Tax=Escallonia herrerae TaxID=1293975 RepID=A0AA89BPU4_9ASTE|nr:hypothetical protein RJ639_028108 [Escallonia herrerae]